VAWRNLFEIGRRKAAKRALYKTRLHEALARSLAERPGPAGRAGSPTIALAPETGLRRGGTCPLGHCRDALRAAMMATFVGLFGTSWSCP